MHSDEDRVSLKPFQQDQVCGYCYNAPRIMKLSVGAIELPSLAGPAKPSEYNYNNTITNSSLLFVVGKSVCC